jgi:LmbE family N-acetylglucosaminyl deacetylase
MIESWAKVIFFGAHTDDEFACAGTLHRLARQGCEVHVVTYAPAAIESDRLGNKASADVVRHEWARSLDTIGVGRHHRWFCEMTPSADLWPRRQEMAQLAYDYVGRHRPDAVFTLSPDDENPAHRIVAEEVERVMRGRVPCLVRCQMPWNYSIGRGNFYVALSGEDMACKRAVVECYQSQKFRYDYSAIFEHLALADGLSVKVPAAERFELVRAVV